MQKPFYLDMVSNYEGKFYVFKNCGFTTAQCFVSTLGLYSTITILAEIPSWFSLKNKSFSLSSANLKDPNSEVMLDTPLCSH